MRRPKTREATTKLIRFFFDFFNSLILQDEEKDKKKKKKVKLLFEEIQVFDANTTDVYVWVFDPTPFWKKCVGILMVLGTIGGCLFPLW